MKLVFLIGNAAVGKMTVGQELMKLTGLRLFHNHMTIEPVIEIFGRYNGQAINRLREVIFEEFARSDCYGMIFTYMWAFDQPSDWDYIAHVRHIFAPYQTEFYSRSSSKSSKRGLKDSMNLSTQRRISPLKAAWAALRPSS